MGFLPLALSFFSFQASYGQNPANRNQTTEEQYFDVTQQDITQIQDIDAESISVVGIHLGTGLQAAKQTIARKKGIFFRQDKFNNYRLYLYDYRKQPDGDNKPLGYFKWEHRDSGLSEIVLYKDFGRYMEGQSRKLVTAEALSYYEEGVGKNFLGYPHKKENILHVPSQNIKHTAYYYKGKAYQVIKQVRGDHVKYSFGFFDKHTDAANKSTAP